MRLFGILLLAGCLSAQEPKFGAQSRLVLVPATVTDSSGRPVDGLLPADFTLLDNGRKRAVTVDTFDTGVAPLALVIAVQVSGISAPALEKLREVAGMIKPVVTGERGCAAVLAFAEQVTWKQPCTRDDVALNDAFQRLQPREHKSARMLDAVHEAVKKLRERENARRVLLLVSESRDRDSESDLQSAVAAAQAAGVTVYAATYSALKSAFTSDSRDAGLAPKRPPAERDPNAIPGRDPVPKPVEQRVDIIAGVGELARLGTTNTTEVLTAATGGTTFSFTRQKALEETIQKLGEELNSQYVLSFTPEDASPGFHTLQVLVTKPGAKVRARPGYWATETP